MAVTAYAPIVERRKDTEFGERERQFQLYRRGRYVEFNSLRQRHAVCGLQTGGYRVYLNVDAAISALAICLYARGGKPRADLYDNYLKPRDWV